MRHRREMETQLRDAARLLDRIDRKVEGIERITMVREPATGIAADAYDGLRRQVGTALAERAAHLHQLAQFDAARRAGATPDELGNLVREWMGEARLEVVVDPDVPGAFTEVGAPEGDHVRVAAPAYVDALTGRVVRGGFVERTTRPRAKADTSASSADGHAGTGAAAETSRAAQATGEAGEGSDPGAEEVTDAEGASA